jgi:hypothetical protein
MGATLCQLYMLLAKGNVEGCSLQTFEDATGLKLMDANGLRLRRAERRNPGKANRESDQKTTVPTPRPSRRMRIPASRSRPRSRPPRVAQSYLNTPAGKAAIGAPAAWVQVAPIIVGKPAATPAPPQREPPEIRWLG